MKSTPKPWPANPGPVASRPVKSRRSALALPGLVLLLAGLFTLPPLAALEDLDKVEPSLRSAPISIQPESLMVMFSPLKEGGYFRSDSLSKAITENSNIKVNTESPTTTSSYVFDTNGRLLDYVNIVLQGPEADKARARSAGQGGPPGNRVYTRIQRLADGSYRQYSREKDGKEEQKDFSLSGKDVLFFQLPYLIQKAVKSGITGGFNFDGVFGAGFKQNFDLRLFRTTSPQSTASQYRYPEAVSTAFQKQDIQTLAELSLTGLAGLVYPHKIYFAYGKPPECYLRAFWGGEPGKDFFQIEQVP